VFFSLFPRQLQSAQPIKRQSHPPMNTHPLNGRVNTGSNSTSNHITYKKQ
jgi:hypothetical protein